MNNNIVFIIPSTCKKKNNYTNIDDIPLLSILYKSLINFNISKYTFIIGMDDDDEYYLNNLNGIKNKLPNNFHFHFIKNIENSYVCIVNCLANLAIKEYSAEYLYVFADDLIVNTLEHIDIFISYFNKNNNLCLGWGQDQGCLHTCSHPFIHRNHVDILGFFYPNEIKNWFCDDYIEKLYTKLNKLIKTEKCVINNIIAHRYDVVHINNSQLEILVEKSFNIICSSRLMEG